MKIRPVGAEFCIRAGGGTDGRMVGHDETNNSFSQFCERTNSDTICCVIDMAYILCMFVTDKRAPCRFDSSSQSWCRCLGSRKPESSSDMSCSQFSFDLSTRDKAPFVAQAVRLQKYEVTLQNAKQLNRTENLEVLHRYKGVTTCTHRFPTTHRMVTLSEKNAGCVSLLLWTVLHVWSRTFHLCLFTLARNLVVFVLQRCNESSIQCTCLGESLKCFNN